MAYDGYRAIARVYDRLNAELDYAAWADFAEACFSRFLPQKPQYVLDLACGTGRMTLELASRGYDMIGIDGSADMLSQAYDRGAMSAGVLLLHQDMRSFELYGTVGAAVCCLDSLNYLLTPSDLASCLRLVHNYLDPDGLFFFDVNTPFTFENTYGNNAYVLEDELTFEDTVDEEKIAIYCGWQNAYDPESRICQFSLSLFEETEKGTYRREDELQEERCYSMEELRAALSEAGFEFLGVWQDFAFTPPSPEAERWYICARAKKES